MKVSSDAKGLFSFPAEVLELLLESAAFLSFCFPLVQWCHQPKEDNQITCYLPWIQYFWSHLFCYLTKLPHYFSSSSLLPSPCCRGKMGLWEKQGLHYTTHLSLQSPCPHSFPDGPIEHQHGGNWKKSVWGIPRVCITLEPVQLSGESLTLQVEN